MSTLRARLSNIPGPVQGVLWMAAAGISFSVMSGLIRPAAQELHAFQIVFLRNLLGVIIIVPFVMRGIELRVWRSPNIRLHLLRAAVTAGAMLCWFSAIPHIAMAEAIALNFTAPMFVTLLAALVLKETIRARRVTALAIGFIGVLIVVRPGFETIRGSQLLILLDALFWGVAIICIRVLSRTEAPQTIVTYMFLLVLPITAIPALFVWVWPSQQTLLLMLGIALTSTIGHYCSTRAFSVAEASVVMPFDYLRLIWFTTVGYVAFHEVPDRWTLMGALVVAASSLYLLLREHHLVKARRASASQ